MGEDISISQKTGHFYFALTALVAHDARVMYDQIIGLTIFSVATE